MNVKGCVKAVLCPVCRKPFYPTPQWGWKDEDGRRYCRYPCMREAEKARAARKKKATAKKLDSRRVRMVREHARPEAIHEISRQYLAALAECK